MQLALVCLVTDCVMLMFGLIFWMRFDYINEAGSFSVIKTLSFTHKNVVWFQKTWNTATFIAINSHDLTYFCLLHVLYCWQVVRVRVGMWLGAQNIYERINIYNLFYKCMERNKCIWIWHIRQTVESSGEEHLSHLQLL